MVTQNRNKIRIGITAGDPNGIGYEILLKLFSDNRLSELFIPVVYGSKEALEYYVNKFSEIDRIPVSYINGADNLTLKRVNFISVGPSKLTVNPGQSEADAGNVAISSLRTAVKDLHSGLIDALVTGPIDKNNTYSEEFPFVGHTAFFASEFLCEGKEPLMFMVSENVKVGLVTMHSSINSVPSLITQENIIEHIRLMRNSLIEDFSSTNPKIAVLSLNPHCGDRGVIGNEDDEIIRPAVEAADKEGIIVRGPFAADGFFGSGMYSQYDAVLAMYHDQGLIAFKSLAQDGGVNFTAGLSIVRTSPAHGVGYDIAGQGIADPSSFRSAIFTAIDIVRRRQVYDEITSNQLKYIRKRGNDKIQREQNVDEMLPQTELE